ncbi:hypothetical protein DEU56DRAFT_778523 [Suillus clintonianus]|uniref:uncharacterized protein n=1 Tax=Suillus clintonianus TaxID=1904413 RepID=UPI001B8713F7|nr:uncharacterized protein DEU56DRAFT_778523 [Suillus clintonianus]KAG2150762.1 hypothetical protein DEU56DRAFT_778523 [Suillus clintonianus]
MWPFTTYVQLWWCTALSSCSEKSSKRELCAVVYNFNRYHCNCGAAACKDQALVQIKFESTACWTQLVSLSSVQLECHRTGIPPMQQA